MLYPFATVFQNGVFSEEFLGHLWSNAQVGDGKGGLRVDEKETESQKAQTANGEIAAGGPGQSPEPSGSGESTDDPQRPDRCRPALPSFA